MDYSDTPAYPPCEAAYSHVISSLVKDFGAENSKFGGEGNRVIAETIAGFIGKTQPHAKPALECFGQLRNMFVLMREQNAVLDGCFSFASAELDPYIFATFQGYLAKCTCTLDQIQAVGITDTDLAAPLCEFCQ